MIPYIAILQPAFLQRIADWALTHGIKIIAIILGAYIVRKLLMLVIRGVILRALNSDLSFGNDQDRKKRTETFVALISAVLRVVIWFAAGMLILQELTINLGPLVAGAGVLGVALAFGTQSLVADFVSGLFIIAENQYRLGDVVDLDGTSGTVEQISIRTTVLRDVDGNVHYVPNGTIQRATNKTMGFSKVNLTFAVGPETNLDKLATLIDAIGTDMAAEKEWKKRIIEPPKFLRIGNFTDTAIEVLIVGKTKPADQWAVTGEFRQRLLAAFKKKNISVPQLPGAVPISAAPTAKRR